eukprot:924152-Ditylum_brightwellii.AAC.1
MQGVVVTSQMKKILHNASSCVDIQHCISTKTGLTIEMMSHVQWSALSNAFENLTLFNKIQVLKFQHNWLPMGSRLKELYLLESLKCPWCGQISIPLCIPRDKLGNILTQAISNQQYIGWDNFVKGQLSKYWGKAQ